MALASLGKSVWLMAVIAHPELSNGGGHAVLREFTP